MSVTDVNLPEKVSRLSDEELTDLLESEALRHIDPETYAREVDVLARAEAFRRWGSIFPPKRVVTIAPDDTLSKYDEPLVQAGDKGVRKLAVLAILLWDAMWVLSGPIYAKTLSDALPDKNIAETIGVIIGTIIGFLFFAGWEAIPCLHFYRGKNWARYFLYTTRLLWLVLGIGLAIYFKHHVNYLMTSLNAGALGCQVLLLRKQTTRNAARGFFLIFVILAAVVFVSNVPYWNQEIGVSRLIRSGQSVSEYESVSNYKAAIPTGWRVLDKAAAAKIMARDISTADFVVGKEGGYYGLFFAEMLPGDIYSQPDALKRLSEWLRQTFFPNMDKIEPYAVNGGTGLRGRQTLEGREYVYFGFFKPLKTVGVTGYIWAPANNADSLAGEVNMFQNGLEELPQQE